MFMQILHSIMLYDGLQEYFEETSVKLCGVQCIELLIHVVKKRRMIWDVATAFCIFAIDSLVL